METLAESPSFLPRSSSWHQAAHQALWPLLWCPGRPRAAWWGHRPKDTMALVPRTPESGASVPSHAQGRAQERQCPCSQTTLFKESLKAFTKSMQGFLGILIFKLNRDCNLGITEPQARKSSPVPLTQTCSAGRNETLLGDLQPKGVGGSMWLQALPLSPVLPARSLTVTAATAAASPGHLKLS